MVKNVNVDCLFIECPLLDACSTYANRRSGAARSSGPYADPPALLMT
jgi:hypothetical protein